MLLQKESQDFVSKRAEVVSMFPANLQRFVSEIPEEILQLDEQSLEASFSSTTVDYMLRKRLWEIFERNKNLGVSQIAASEIYDGICARQNFFQIVLPNHKKLAWLLIRPVEYEAIIEESFMFALKRLRNEVLTMKVTEKTAPVLLKSLEFLANRAIGPLVQKIESKSLNMNVGGTAVENSNLTQEQIASQIRELQSRIGKPVQEVRELKDVEAE